MLPPELGMMTSDFSMYLEAVLQLFYFVLNWQRFNKLNLTVALSFLPSGNKPLGVPKVELFCFIFLVQMCCSTWKWTFCLEFKTCHDKLN